LYSVSTQKINHAYTNGTHLEVGRHPRLRWIQRLTDYNQELDTRYASMTTPAFYKILSYTRKHVPFHAIRFITNCRSNQHSATARRINHMYAVYDNCKANLHSVAAWSVNHRDVVYELHDNIEQPALVRAHSGRFAK
jgi:hypothetical protein